MTSLADRALGVADVELDLGVERLTAEVAPGPAEDAAVARALQRGVHGAVDVDRDAGPFGRQRVALPARAHDDRAAQRFEHGAAELGARLLGAEPRDVDAADADALADLLGVRVIVGVHSACAGEEQQTDDGGDDNNTCTHGGP